MQNIILLLTIALAALPCLSQSRYIVTLDDPNTPRIGDNRRELETLSAYLADLTGEQAAKLRKDSRVKFVEQDRPITIAAVEDNAPWGLARIDQKAYAPDAVYNYNATGTGVDVYVVDTGINFTHQDFGGRAKPFYDAFGGDGSDCNGHGTHVSGIVGGVIFGVAKQVNIYSARVADCSGNGQISDLIAAIDKITATKKRGKNYHDNPAVVNISMTAAGSSPSLESAIETSISSGIVYAVAAGNGSYDACNFTPARTPDALTIGASDETDFRALYSNWGACVDLFAPGNQTISDWIGSDVATNNLSGTSMASPHAAGVAALYFETHRKASALKVINAMKQNATPGALTNDIGAGSPNLLLYSGL